MATLAQILSKKRDAGPVAAPRWHPNFRNYERLPDTKVVRTTFFINTAAIAVAAMLVLWTGYREYRIYSLKQQVTEAQAEIDANSKQNAEGLRLSKLFSDEDKRIAEVAKFTAIPLVPSEFIAALGETLPKNVGINTVDVRFREQTGPIIMLQGTVTGPPDQATGVASSYADVFKTEPRFVAWVNSSEITAVNRDAGAESVTFQIILRLKDPTKEKKP